MSASVHIKCILYAYLQMSTNIDYKRSANRPKPQMQRSILPDRIKPIEMAESY